MKILRFLLMPLTPIYYLVVWIRNRMYDYGIFSSVTFSVPVLAVGNLSVGGTGKTPMVEYLIQLLQPSYKVAVLSRGYKRSTKGFLEVMESHSARDVGDEPLQFKKKFPKCTIAVDANRVRGIQTLLNKNIPDVILLDDAFQHRRVKAGMYILLTSYSKIYVEDRALPWGDLREPQSGAKRAAVIIVTKCPPDLSEEERKRIRQKLNTEPNQTVYFSSIQYGQKIGNGREERDLTEFGNPVFTLVTGIANPKPLVEHYKKMGLRFTHKSYSDHHNFSLRDIRELEEESMIVTTEKDFMRLSPYISTERLWYQPIEMSFIEDEVFFVQKIKAFLKMKPDTD